jgi:hypothetical protein
VEWLQKQSWLILLAISITLTLLNPINVFGAVGKVTELTGPAEIVRNKKSTESKVNSPVEMNDTIVTAKARATLTFEDNTNVKITEQSKLVIDDFVYDPKKGTGKLAMKVVLGTARYASGQIAKSNPQNVNVQTPTATVAVRGTDFSMTVDELGRSLIVLLPSCDAKSCVTGAIVVKNDAGEVYMDQPYQATLVASLSTPPSKPTVLNLDQNNINNLLIVSKPKEVEEEIVVSKNPLDINFLNVDYLKYDELDKDHLKYDALSFNALDGELLGNVLDQSTRALLSSAVFFSEANRMLPGYNEDSGLKYALDDQDKLYLTKITTHTAQIIVHKEADLVINMLQSGVPTYQKVNTGGTTTININQR